jgi:hypothetical protein
MPSQPEVALPGQRHCVAGAQGQQGLASARTQSNDVDEHIGLARMGAHLRRHERIARLGNLWGRLRRAACPRPRLQSFSRSQSAQDSGVLKRPGIDRHVDKKRGSPLQTAVYATGAAVAFRDLPHKGQADAPAFLVARLGCLRPGEHLKNILDLGRRNRVARVVHRYAQHVIDAREPDGNGRVGRAVLHRIAHQVLQRPLDVLAAPQHFA